MENEKIVRKVDHLGRIVLPIEMRQSLEIKEADTMEIVLVEDGILLKKYNKED